MEAARWSIPPGIQIGSLRTPGLHLFGPFADEHLVIVQTAQIIGQFMVAIPAMLGAGSIVDFAVAGRLIQFFEHFFRAVNGVVQEIAVHFAHVNVDLALQLGAQPGPVPVDDVSEIVMIPPIPGY
jgi:hypothetical protein